MRHGFLVAVALAALVANAPVSFAFELQTLQTNPDGSAKITGPSNFTDGTTGNVPGQSGDNALHFGNTTLRFGGSSGSGAFGSGAFGSDAFGSGNSGMSPALQQRLMLGPYAVGGAGQWH